MLEHLVQPPDITGEETMWYEVVKIFAQLWLAS